MHKYQYVPAYSLRAMSTLARARFCKHGMSNQGRCS